MDCLLYTGRRYAAKNKIIWIVSYIQIAATRLKTKLIWIILYIQVAATRLRNKESHKDDQIVEQEIMSEI